MDQKEIKALISLLDDDDKEIFEHVEQKIISYGDVIIPFLEEEWENNFNPLVQKRIEELIHSLQFELLKSRLKKWKEDGYEDLLEGMWIVSTYQYPDVDLDILRDKMEQLYYEAWLDFKDEMHHFDQIKVLNHAMFTKLKFSANTKNFHSPANSMINMVLETKKGNPISLCVLYLLIAQRLKLPVYGVNLPNLFVLTYKTKEVQFYINVFNKGLIFSKEDIDNYISHLDLSPIDVFYEPCSNLSIIKRVFRNLIASFEKLGDAEKVEEVKHLLMVISDENEQP